MTSERNDLPPGGGPMAFAIALARPHRLAFATTLVTSALSAILALVPALAVYLITDRLYAETHRATGIAWIAALALGCVVAGLLLSALTTLLGHKLAFAIQRRLRLDLVHRLSRVPVSRVEGRAGEIKKVVLGDVDRLEGLYAHVLPDIAAGLAAPVAGAILLAFIDWRIVLASLAMLPLAWLAQVWTYRGRTALFEEWNVRETEANTALLGYVRGIATLKAFNRQATTLANVTFAVHRLRDLAVEITRRARYPYALFSSTLSTNLLVVLPAALALYQAGEIDRAEFVLATLLGASLTAPLGKAVFATLIFGRTAVALERIRALLSLDVIEDRGQATLPASNEICFETVSFAYPDGRTVLDEIDLEIPEGSITAIVGASGAGKSTLARLLPRLEDCTSGRITLGGIDIRDLPHEALRSRIGMVFQDPVLFRGSLDENIRMARPDADMRALSRSIEGARLTDMGEGVLETAVSDLGAGLSGGQKQRAAIARMLLKNAPILILDEATAFVDPENEAEVQRAIAAAGKGRSVIVIAHRLASVVDADQIVVLDAGRIEAKGRHEDLLARSPTYARLWAAQQSATGWRLARAEELAASS